MKEIYQAAYKYSIYNKELLKKSGLCGCFYCCLLFQYERINEWIDGDPDLPHCVLIVALIRSFREVNTTCYR
ncbi:cytoplasmic protein [Enterococcus avium]|uniref:cytoplasmic protein n=1 Tax=Enterococcus avium TaxID=33945 RepID=UPI003D6AA401